MPEDKTTLSTRFNAVEIAVLQRAAREREWSLSHILHNGALRLAERILTPQCGECGKVHHPACPDPCGTPHEDSTEGCGE